MQLISNESPDILGLKQLVQCEIRLNELLDEQSDIRLQWRQSPAPQWPSSASQHHYRAALRAVLFLLVIGCARNPLQRHLVLARSLASYPKEQFSYSTGVSAAALKNALYTESPAFLTEPPNELNLPSGINQCRHFTCLPLKP